MRSSAFGSTSLWVVASFSDLATRPTAERSSIFSSFFLLFSPFKVRHHYFGFLTGYEFPHGIHDVIFLWRHFFSGFMTSYFCDVISSPGLWRHIFVTSFLRRVYDVIFLWRHFFSGFMTSYFCDVISSSGLWRHIFVTSFLRRVYDVIILWRHFFVGFMTS
jgi:hypothetical protein